MILGPHHNTQTIPENRAAERNFWASRYRSAVLHLRGPSFWLSPVHYYHIPGKITNGGGQKYFFQLRMVKVGSTVFSSGQHRMTPIYPEGSEMLQKHYISILIRVRDDIRASVLHSGHPGGIRTDQRDSVGWMQCWGLALPFGRPSPTGSVLVNLPSQTFSDHLRPDQTISDHLEPSQTTSDFLRLSHTISDHYLRKIFFSLIVLIFSHLHHGHICSIKRKRHLKITHPALYRTCTFPCFPPVWLVRPKMLFTQFY